MASFCMCRVLLIVFCFLQHTFVTDFFYCFPSTFCLCDKQGCISVTIYNMVQGGGVKIGDSVAIPEPYGQVVQVNHKDKVCSLHLQLVMGVHSMRESLWSEDDCESTLERLWEITQSFLWCLESTVSRENRPSL